jgi:predicted MFS family arabinose efflux permease
VTSDDQSEAGANDIERGHAAALGCLCLTALAVAVHANVLGALKAFLPADLVRGDESFGLLVAIAAYAGAGGALLAGPAFDRMGRRTLLVHATGAFALASLLHVWLRFDYLAFAFVRAAAGFAGGVAYAGASILVADLVPYARRGRTMMLFSAAVFLAMPVGLPIAVLFARFGAWPGIFVVQAVLAGIAVLGMLRFLPDRLDVVEAHDGGRFGAVREALRSRGVLAALISAALYSGAFFATVQFASGWLNDEGILLKRSQALMWIVLGLASAGSLVLGGLSDRLGKRNFVIATTAAVGAGILGLGAVDDLVAVTLIGVPVAVLAAARAGALLALITGLVPSRARGSLMGFRSGFIQIGMASMAWLAGVLSAGGGFHLLTIGMAVVIALALGLIVVAVPEPSGDIDRRPATGGEGGGG